MKRVQKSLSEPKALTDYKNRFKNAPKPPTWKEFKKTPAKKEMQNQLREDQRGLCAYCENSLIPNDESVEHFIARNADHSLELEWSNLLLCCGGGEHPLPEDVEDRDLRHDPKGSKTCGHAKLNSRDPILNPLNIPHTPRLFRFRSESGEIEPDQAACQDAVVDWQLANQSIGALGLRAGRLNRARLSLLNVLLEQLNGEGPTEPFSRARERELAEMYLPATGLLPRFFTTIRFFLGEEAEAHLSSISYQG